MVTIPPIYGDLGDGLFLFYSFTNIISIKVTLLFGWINHYSPLWFTIWENPKSAVPNFATSFFCGMWIK